MTMILFCNFIVLFPRGLGNNRKKKFFTIAHTDESDTNKTRDVY